MGNLLSRCCGHRHDDEHEHHYEKAVEDNIDAAALSFGYEMEDDVVGTSGEKSDLGQHPTSHADVHDNVLVSEERQEEDTATARKIQACKDTTRLLLRELKVARERLFDAYIGLEARCIASALLGDDQPAAIDNRDDTAADADCDWLTGGGEGGMAWLLVGDDEGQWKEEMVDDNVGDDVTRFISWLMSEVHDRVEIADIVQPGRVLHQSHGIPAFRGTPGMTWDEAVNRITEEENKRAKQRSEDSEGKGIWRLAIRQSWNYKMVDQLNFEDEAKEWLEEGIQGSPRHSH